MIIITDFEHAYISCRQYSRPIFTLCAMHDHNILSNRNPLRDPVRKQLSGKTAQTPCDLTPSEYTETVKLFLYF